MKILAAITLTAAVGVSGWAETGGPDLERQVTVCIDRGTATSQVYLARDMASKIFKRIGVKIDWRRNGHNCPVASGVITISVSDTAPESQPRNALAYALPYEGTHIVVFYDRVKTAVRAEQVPYLLAHVLVHEITHILQGIKRHSESGIMRAIWSNADYFEMQRGGLGFTEGDVDLIYLGLDARARHAAAN